MIEPDPCPSGQAGLQVNKERGRLVLYRLLSGKHAVNRALIGVCLGSGMSVLGMEYGWAMGVPGVGYCPYRAMFALGGRFSTDLLPRWGRKGPLRLSVPSLRLCMKYLYKLKQPHSPLTTHYSPRAPVS